MEVRGNFLHFICYHEKMIAGQQDRRNEE